MIRCGIINLLLLVTVVFSSPQSFPQYEQDQPQYPAKSNRPTPVYKKVSGLELPDNATLIRDNIVDSFTCKDRLYGYYADMENDCQIFHICLPQERGTVRWSFICPAETVFNQATFVCTRTDSSIPCEESEKYYILNEELGKVDEEEGNELDKPSRRDPDADLISRPYQLKSKSPRVNEKIIRKIK